jgi:MFS family permease
MVVLHRVSLGSIELGNWLCRFLAGFDGDQGIPWCIGSGRCQQPRSNAHHILTDVSQGYYPGCIYLISSWYKRYELQKRISAFFTTATALSGFANIFALGLVQISRVSSLSGWRWIFIIEGAITMIAAVAAYFIIVDFPASKSNKFLTEEERAFVQARLFEDRGAEDEHVKINAAVIFRTALDWKIWSFSMMYFAGAR